MSQYSFINTHFSPHEFANDPVMMNMAIKHNQYRSEYNNKPKEIIHYHYGPSIPVSSNGPYMTHCYFNSGNSIKNVIG